MKHDSWDRAYMALHRTPAEPEPTPVWSDIEIPALAVILAIALFVIFTT